MVTERVAPAAASTPVRSFFCPGCFTHLSVATDFDRRSFKNWLRGHQHCVEASALLAHNIGLISAICDSADGYLLPLDTLWERLLCPPCGKRLIEGSIDTAPITCPNCGKCNARSQGCDSHVVIREFDDRT